MSSSLEASKLSEVLEVMTEQPEKMSHKISAVYSLNIEHNKQVFTDAVHYCMVLLKQSNRFAKQTSEVLSLEATLMGHEIFEKIIGVTVQMDVEAEGEYFVNDEGIQKMVKPEIKDDYEETPFSELELQADVAEEEKVATPVTTPVKVTDIEEKSTTPTTPSLKPMVVEIPREIMKDFIRHSESATVQKPKIEKDLPLSPESLLDSTCTTKTNSKEKSTVPLQKWVKIIPLELKLKVINMARAHPNWSIKTLRKVSRVPYVSSIPQLKVWEKQIANGGTRHDKCSTINIMAYERYLEARAENQLVTAEMISKWAIEAAKAIYGPEFRFEASRYWTTNFKRTYNLEWTVSEGYIIKNEKKTTQAAQSKNRKRKR